MQSFASVMCVPPSRGFPSPSLPGLISPSSSRPPALIWTPFPLTLGSSTLTPAQQEFPSFSALCDHITRYHGQIQGEDVPIANRTMGWSQQPPSPDNPFRQPPPLVPYVVEPKGKVGIRERVRRKKIELTVAEDGTRKEFCRIL